jgi:hypothetical protein
MLDVEEVVRRELATAMSNLSKQEIANRSTSIAQDARLLARCAASACRITYTSAIELRQHGNAQSGQWLDDVFDFALHPMQLPDLTLLVVNKATGKPSEGAYHEGQMKKSGIRPEEVRSEQRRAAAFKGYSKIFGQLEPIPSSLKHSHIVADQELENENGIERAVRNALLRIDGAGRETTRIGRDYPDSLSSDKLKALARRLMRDQKGHCALTGTPFDEASEVDRVSLDRIDCDRGYADGNVQLVTVFANRARGTLDVSEARCRLVQWDAGG